MIMMYIDDNEMPTELIRKEKTIEIPLEHYNELLDTLEHYMALTCDQSELIANMSKTIDRLMHDLGYDDESENQPFSLTHRPGELPELHIPEKEVYKGAKVEIGPGKFRLNIKFGKK